MSLTARRDPEIGSYDTKCFNLAEGFLSDEPDLDTERNRRRLATTIQRAIEDEIAGFRFELEERRR